MSHTNTHVFFDYLIVLMQCQCFSFTFNESLLLDVFTYKKLSFLSLQIEASQHHRSALLIIYFHYNNSPDSQDDKTLLLAGNFFTENNSQPPYKDLLFWDMFLYVNTSKSLHFPVNFSMKFFESSRKRKVTIFSLLLSLATKSSAPVSTVCPI